MLDSLMQLMIIMGFICSLKIIIIHFHDFFFTFLNHIIHKPIR